MTQQTCLEHNVYKSKLVCDYLQNKIKLNDFIDTGLSINDFKTKFDKQRISDKSRQILFKSIQNQYIDSGISEPINLTSLLDSNTFTITTGHQLCLFGGSQLLINKIVSVIKMTILLKQKYPEYNFIPIFWMASEDHDFDEIKKINIFNKQINIEGEYSGAVGRMKSSRLKSAFEELKKLFINDDKGNEIIKIISDSNKRNTLSQSIRYLLHNLFSEHKLIIVDGDDKELKKLFIPIIKNELLYQSSNIEVQKTNNKLEKLGYKAQAHSRNINLFYLKSNSRERIIFEKNIYKIGNDTFSKEDILKLANDFPEKFSPNVILRPIYQETILPNLAYIGGPAEVSYWAQLKQVFLTYNISHPKVYLRESFAFINEIDFNYWKQQNLKIEDLFINFDFLARTIITNNKEVDFESELRELIQIKDKLIEKTNTINKSLSNSIAGEFTKLNKAINKTEKRLIKSIKDKDEKHFNRLKKIKESIFYNNSLIERSDSFIPLYNDLKEKYINTLIKESTPFEVSFKLIIFTK